MKYSILILLVFFSFSVIAETETRTRVCKAFDLNTGELIYTESHNETYKAGIIISDEVIYRDTSNNIIAIKKVDYSNGMIMPDFMLKNMETGHIESALKEADQLKVIFSKNKNDLKKEAVIPLPDKAIIDAGFDQFIIEHWDEIIQGERLVRKMLIPSMKKFIEFRIYQKNIDEINNKRTLIVEPNSMFIRFVADPLILEYDFDKPRLYVFEGVSNMRNLEGDNLQVKITFAPENYQITAN